MTDGSSDNPLRDPQDRRLPRIAGPCGMVIFGVTGDLSRKKLMPAIYDLASRGLLPPGFSLVGFARRDWADQDFAQIVHDAVKEYSRTEFREEVWQQLAEGFRFVPGDFSDDLAFETLRQTIVDLDRVRGTGGNHAFYLSIPPRFFSDVIGQLKEHGLAEQNSNTWRRVVVEKPFGSDLETARELNAIVSEVFPSGSVFRIDHYLGKETVQNILAMRFANSMFEPIWNSNYVDHVQITMAEDIGIGGRAGYYDGIGAARDVIQNHLIQLMALIAMEEPTSFDARSLRIEKQKVLESVVLPRRLDLHTARGQYVEGWAGGKKVPGYKEEADIPAGSKTETFAAIRLDIESRRWAGVPFYLRTGKRLPCRATEIVIQFKQVPLMLFRQIPIEHVSRNQLVMRIQPDEGIALRFQAKVPGTAVRIGAVDMNFRYHDYFGERPATGYERLLHDCILGDATLFQREDMLEAAWSVVAPIQEVWKALPARGFPNYPAGTWGPEEADELMTKDGRHWRSCGE